MYVVFCFLNVISSFLLKRPKEKAKDCQPVIPGLSLSHWTAGHFTQCVGQWLVESLGGGGGAAISEEVS